MPKFTEQTNPKTTLKIRESHVPSVYITEEALYKMSAYVDHAPGQDEIGWLGTAYRDGSEFFIEDVFLFKQEVHGTTTEITPEGLAEFAEELLLREDGMEIWNNLKMWGHSHVNMGISPSGQDDKQMEAFANIGHDFFIRLICNKQGEMGIDVYLYEEGLEFHNVPWMTQHNDEDEQIVAFDSEIAHLEEQIAMLRKQEEEYQKAKEEVFATPIKDEIKEKVKKLTYSPIKINKSATTTKQGTAYGKYGKYYDYYEDGFGEFDLLDPTLYAEVDQIDDVKFTVYDFYSQHDLALLANTCTTIEDLLEDAEYDGLQHMLSLNDFKKIWNKIVDIQVNSAYGGGKYHGYGY